MAVKGTWNIGPINLPDFGLTERLGIGKKNPLVNVNKPAQASPYTPPPIQMPFSGLRKTTPAPVSKPQATTPTRTAAPSPTPLPPPTEPIASQMPGAGAYDDYVSKLQEIRQAAEDQMNQQRAEEESLFAEYQKAATGGESPTATYERLSSQYGLPEIMKGLETYRKQGAGVESLLSNLEPDVTARTTGSLLTEAERRYKVATEEAPLRKQLGELALGERTKTYQLGDVANLINTQLQLKQQERSQTLEPLKLRLSSLTDRFAREITGYNQSAEMELNTLSDKLGRERTLADREWQRMSDLAKMEREYQLKKKYTTGSTDLTDDEKKLLLPGGGDTTTQKESKPTYLPGDWEDIWKGIVPGSSAAPAYRTLA